MQQRDQRTAEELKKELKRLFELDRQHRLRNGAAETNLAALRERVSKREGEREREQGSEGARETERQRGTKRRRVSRVVRPRLIEQTGTSKHRFGVCMARRGWLQRERDWFAYKCGS